MSKNHPNDNIYSILGKLDALKPTPEEKRFALVKEIRESIEAKGSITAGVSSVEAKLRQQFAESDFSKMSTAIQKTGKSKASADAITAAAGRKKLGQKEMTRRSVAGRKDECTGCAMGECSVHGMMESGDLGQQINDLFGQIYDFGSGDDSLEYLDRNAPLWTELFDKHEGDIDAIVANEPDDVLAQVVEELEGVLSDLPYELDEAGITTRKPGVTTHTKTDFPGYPSDDLEKDDDDRTGPKAIGGRGRPRKAQTKNPRPVVGAEKKGRGRPAKVSAPTFSKMADPFGRVSGAVPAGKQGTVHSMSESMNRLETRLVEGLNFKKMAEETHQSIDELMSELQQDITAYKATGHCSDKLKDFLTVHSHSKKQVADEAAMEAAAQGIGHDLVTPAERLAPTTSKPGIGGALSDIAKGAKDWIQGKPDTGPTYEEVDPMEHELNELARLAGLTVADEGNAFGQQVRQKKSDNIPNSKQSIELDGNEYPVKEADAPVDEPVEEPVNAPKPEYKTMRQSSMNPGEGDNGEKAMHGNRPTFKNGDNPLTKPTLEARLAAEYESIKKVSK